MVTQYWFLRVVTEITLVTSDVEGLTKDGRDTTRKPDIAVYPKDGLMDNDLTKMTEMPITAIEILSPTQDIDDLTEKIPIYEKKGIQSYWIVYPEEKKIEIYYGSEKTTFGTDDALYDCVIGVGIPMAALFA